MSRIILIDDDRQVCGMLKKMLTRAGYEVEDFHDADKACEAFRDHGADLVITDIFMPVKSGLEVIAELKESEPDLKIIAMSGGARGGNFNFLPVTESMGVTLTMQKPFSQKDLLKNVKDLLKQD